MSFFSRSVHSWVFLARLFFRSAIAASRSFLGDLAELDVVEGVFKVFGPLSVEGGIALGGGVGEGPRGDVVELDAGGDLGTGNWSVSIAIVLRSIWGRM
ncbi:hypothetical protein AB0M42_07995 [Streptomyces sp. NPDC051784]|uniref:hypothetical protein n=1 Tax=Streptomyces sp. NPDC051784 TaxID=3155805 RepID=UPI00341D5B75